MKQFSTLLFTLLITLIVFNAQAQDKSTGPSSYVGFYGGLSKPLGDFASTDYHNNSSGLAVLGSTYSVTGARYVYKNLAIAGSISFSDEGRPTSTALQGLSDGYNADFKGSSTSVNVTNRYQNLNLLLGPQYTFVYGNLNVDLRISAGVIKSFSTPEYTTYVTVPAAIATTTTITQNSSTATAFAYSGSIGLRYNLTEGFGVGLTGAYVNNGSINISTDGDTFTNGRLVTKQPIAVLQGTLGFYFNF